MEFRMNLHPKNSVKIKWDNQFFLLQFFTSFYKESIKSVINQKLSMILLNFLGSLISIFSSEFSRHINFQNFKLNSIKSFF